MNYVVKIINFIIIRLFGFYLKKSEEFLLKTNNKLFKKSRIMSSSQGYHYLNPMPSKKNLDDYYLQVYPKTKKKFYGVNSRDIIHYCLLKKYISAEIIPKKNFLNFGAAHCGISHLLWLQGLNIINCDFHEIPKFYNENWHYFQNLNDLKDQSVDIIYGSHSLEHVDNIENYKKEFQRILKPSGVLFFEVPNALNDKAGVKSGTVVIPHTYYFEKTFFENWFDEVILNKSYDQTFKIGGDNKNWVIENWENYENPNGPVLRSLGRIH